MHHNSTACTTSCSRREGIGPSLKKGGTRARGPKLASCALRAPTVAFAPCGHRATRAQCEGELKRGRAERRPCCKERVLATVHVRDRLLLLGTRWASSSPWG